MVPAVFFTLFGVPATSVQKDTLGDVASDYFSILFASSSNDRVIIACLCWLKQVR